MLSQFADFNLSMALAIDGLPYRIAYSTFSGLLIFSPRKPRSICFCRDVYTLSGEPSFVQMLAYFFADFAGRTVLVDSLRASLQKREVALVLGAGVSNSSGIPRWQNLIEGIATKLFHASKNPELISVMGDQGLSPTRRVRFLENYPVVKLLFRQCLFEAMYNGYSPAAHNPEIVGIAQVIANPGAPIDTVITYNFDDVLGVGV